MEIMPESDLAEHLCGSQHNPSLKHNTYARKLFVNYGSTFNTITKQTGVQMNLDIRFPH